MSKSALRVKRYFSPKRGRGSRAPRAKTFTTEESAKAWAAAHGFEKYTLENLKSSESKTNKYRVVVEI